MKLIIIVCVFLLECITASAQKDSVVIRDSWHKRDSVKERSQSKDSIGKEEEMIVWDTLVRRPKESVRVFGTTYEIEMFDDNQNDNSRFTGHWRGFYFGFVNFGNTDYSEYGGDRFLTLDWANSFTMQFNLSQFSLPVNLNFGFVTGLGLEYQRLRFDRNITLHKDEMGQLQPLPLSELGIDRPKRSTFKILYLTLPILMEYQYRLKNKNIFYVSTGFIGGLRLHSKTKIVYKSDKGNKRIRKDSGSYGMAPVKVDYVLRMGFRGISLWGGYTLTHLFNTSTAPGVHPYSIGFGFIL